MVIYHWHLHSIQGIWEEIGHLCLSNFAELWSTDKTDLNQFRQLGQLSINCYQCIYFSIGFSCFTYLSCKCWLNDQVTVHGADLKFLYFFIEILWSWFYRIYNIYFVNLSSFVKTELRWTVSYFLIVINSFPKRNI